ncbi:MAG: hypothetical protein II802_02110 [Clostridia bacterium]|nr:hypothetical protein [Clostridia bacterium]
MDFLTYKNKPLVRKDNIIYYGDMSEPFVVKFEIVSSKSNGNYDLPNKVNVQLLKSDTELAEDKRVVKETTKDSLFDALDFGFIWLERALKESK